MSSAEVREDELPRVPGGQTLLFPQKPRQLCKELGLNWWAAVKLYEDGFLSFDPEATEELDEGQEAELEFVGALITSDCGWDMVSELLHALPKPYAYRHGRIYYDWGRKRWRPVPEESEPEMVFAGWIEELVVGGDTETLEKLRDAIEGGLKRSRSPFRL